MINDSIESTLISSENVLLDHIVSYVSSTWRLVVLKVHGLVILKEAARCDEVQKYHVILANVL